MIVFLGGFGGGILPHWHVHKKDKGLVLFSMEHKMLMLLFKTKTKLGDHSAISSLS